MIPKRLRGAQSGLGTYFGTRKGKIMLVLVAVLFMTVGFRASGLFSTYLSSSDYALIYKTGPRISVGAITIDEGTILVEDDINDIYIDFLTTSPDLDVGTASLVFNIDDSVIATGIYGYYMLRVGDDTRDPDYIKMEYIKIDVSNVYKGEYTYYVLFGGELVGSTYTFNIIGDDTSPVYIPLDDGNGDDNGNGDGEIPVEPTVTEVDDINYTAGTVNNKLVWILQDDNPSWVTVFRDNEIVLDTVWGVQSLTITVDIDGLAIGDYSYKIVGTDMDSNEVEDVVFVTVTSLPGGLDALEDIPIEYLLIGGVVFILLIGGRRN